MRLTLSINHEPQHQLISFLFFLEHIFYVLNIYKIFLNIFHSFNEIKKIWKTFLETSYSSNYRQ